MHTINVIDTSGHQFDIQVNGYPDKCPICHTSVFPRFVAGACDSQVRDKPQAVFRCTNKACGRLFIADYHGSSGILQLGKTEPVYPKSETFSKEINEASPTFVEIYNQSLASQSANLHQLTGIGLRKALEFLVKDFAIHEHSDKTDAIKATPLGQCIEQYISDDRIRTCAKLAAWLGNDETHYVRKWEDKDISDLRILIRLTVNWIENHLLTEQYKKMMMPETEKKEGQT